MGYYGKTIILILAIHGLALHCMAQDFRNIRAYQEGDRILIEYDIVAPENQDAFEVQVYSSIDGYTNPLRFVYGDVGESQNAGEGKKIEWFPEREVPVYQGPLTFELRGKVLSTLQVPPINSAFPKKSKIKRGGKYKISWTGGLPDSRFNIDLYQGGEQVEPVARGVRNDEPFTWRVPKNKLNGNNFYLLITDKTYPANQMTTRKFRVVTPLNPMIQAAVGVAAIIGIYAIFQEAD